MKNHLFPNSPCIPLGSISENRTPLRINRTCVFTLSKLESLQVGARELFSTLLRCCWGTWGPALAAQLPTVLWVSSSQPCSYTRVPQDWFNCLKRAWPMLLLLPGPRLGLKFWMVGPLLWPLSLSPSPALSWLWQEVQVGVCNTRSSSSVHCGCRTYNMGSSFQSLVCWPHPGLLSNPETDTWRSLQPPVTVPPTPRTCTSDTPHLSPSAQVPPLEQGVCLLLLAGWGYIFL